MVPVQPVTLKYLLHLHLKDYSPYQSTVKLWFKGQAQPVRLKHFLCLPFIWEITAHIKQLTKYPELLVGQGSQKCQSIGCATLEFQLPCTYICSDTSYILFLSLKVENLSIWRSIFETRLSTVHKLGAKKKFYCFTFEAFCTVAKSRICRYIIKDMTWPWQELIKA